MNLLPAPILIPVTTVALCLLVWERPAWQRRISIAGTYAHLLAAITLLTQVLRGGTMQLNVGGWPAPFGIVLVADTLSAVLVTVTAVIGTIIVADARRTIGPLHERFGFHPLVHVLLMGVSGAFLTGDLFNLFVWFEVLLISSFVLLSLGAERPQLEASLKYVAINLIASSIFLAAAGLVYASVGSLNLADIAQRVAAREDYGFSVPVGMMLLVAFGIKAGLFPLQAWLPASYHTPPSPIAALFGGLLTKVGVYALLRIFGTVLVTNDGGFPKTVMLVLAGATMLFGGIGALVQTDIRRLLSYCVLNGVGAMVAGIALDGPSGVSAAVLYLLHSAMATTGAFLVAAAIQRATGSPEARSHVGLQDRRPDLVAAWSILALALTGIPPFSGFFGKLALTQAAMAAQAPAIAVCLLVSSVFVLAGFLRVWSLGMARQAPEPNASATRVGIPRGTLLLVGGVTVFFVFLGPLSEVCGSIQREFRTTSTDPLRLGPRASTPLLVGGVTR